ncbi:hypothetical protein CDAR_269531 [Caerostris darwini]|uniref:Uncharacterized protein n=1 Tax=Caerostris darwini TaxID=1538125 RepID=A0AAV4VQV6_9ARAC|nr:hypothetical protein CDAR_269531 [Caerostris darwini]
MNACTPKTCGIMPARYPPSTGNKPSRARLKEFTPPTAYNKGISRNDHGWRKIKCELSNPSFFFGRRFATKDDEARKKELLCPLEELAVCERFSYLLISDFCAASDDSSLSFAGCGLVGETQKITSLSRICRFFKFYFY